MPTFVGVVALIMLLGFWWKIHISIIVIIIIIITQKRTV